MKKNNQLMPMGIFNKGMYANNSAFLDFDLKLWFKKTFIRSIISIVCLTMILIIGSINTKPTNYVINQINYRINNAFHIRGNYNQLKSMASQFTEKSSKALMAINLGALEDIEFINPKNGGITIGFNEKIHEEDTAYRGIVIEGEVGSNVVATQEGVVLELGSSQSLGNYIIIKHRGELLSVYKNLQENIVNKNQKVLMGEVIGKSSGKLLFEVWHDKEPVDPLEYINFDIQNM